MSETSPANATDAASQAALEEFMRISDAQLNAAANQAAHTAHEAADQQGLLYAGNDYAPAALVEAPVAETATDDGWAHVAEGPAFEYREVTGADGHQHLEFTPIVAEREPANGWFTPSTPTVAETPKDAYANDEAFGASNESATDTDDAAARELAERELAYLNDKRANRGLDPLPVWPTSAPTPSTSAPLPKRVPFEQLAPEVAATPAGYVPRPASTVRATASVPVQNAAPVAASSTSGSFDGFARGRTNPGDGTSTYTPEPEAVEDYSLLDLDYPDYDAAIPVSPAPAPQASRRPAADLRPTADLLRQLGYNVPDSVQSMADAVHARRNAAPGAPAVPAAAARPDHYSEMTPEEQLEAIERFKAEMGFEPLPLPDAPRQPFEPETFDPDAQVSIFNDDGSIDINRIPKLRMGGDMYDELTVDDLDRLDEMVEEADERAAEKAAALAAEEAESRAKGAHRHRKERGMKITGPATLAAWAAIKAAGLQERSGKTYNRLPEGVKKWLRVVDLGVAATAATIAGRVIAPALSAIPISGPVTAGIHTVGNAVHHVPWVWAASVATTILQALATLALKPVPIHLTPPTLLLAGLQV
jgi:hypothetical protein